MGIARRYILEVNEVVPVGIETVERTVEYDLRDAFSGETFDGSIVSYSGITTDDIVELSEQEYKDRVYDFLYMINIEEDGKFQLLNSSSIFSNVTCDSPPPANVNIDLLSFNRNNGTIDFTLTATDPPLSVTFTFFDDLAQEISLQTRNYTTAGSKVFTSNITLPNETSYVIGEVTDNNGLTSSDTLNFGAVVTTTSTTTSTTSAPLPPSTTSTTTSTTIPPTCPNADNVYLRYPVPGQPITDNNILISFVDSISNASYGPSNEIFVDDFSITVSADAPGGRITIPTTKFIPSNEWQTNSENLANPLPAGTYNYDVTITPLPGLSTSSCPIYKDSILITVQQSF